MDIVALPFTIAPFWGQKNRVRGAAIVQQESAQ